MTINLNSKINILINGQNKRFTIVNPKESDPVNGRVSYDSPIAQAVIGLKIGEKTEAKLPNNRKAEIEILNIAE